MIAKSLLTALTLLLLYTMLIVGFQDSIHRTGMTAAQRNMVKAEEYLYEANSQYDTVLVGSSMSERLIMGSLREGCYNLAMAGMSSLDGLQLIKQGTHWPRLIYVELNTLPKGQTSDLLQTVNQPGRQFINQYLPFLRQKYKPVGVVKAVLRDWKYGRNQFISFGSGLPFDSAFQRKAVHEQLVAMQSMPPDSVLQANVESAWRFIDAFRQKGVQVVFFEVPVDVRLQNRLLTTTMRQYLSQRFPASQYLTVTVPSDTYQTNDGIHLTQPENTRYSAYLRHQLNQLDPNHLLTY